MGDSRDRCRRGAMHRADAKEEFNLETQDSRAFDNKLMLMRCKQNVIPATEDIMSRLLIALPRCHSSRELFSINEIQIRVCYNMTAFVLPPPPPPPPFQKNHYEGSRVFKYWHSLI